MMPLNLTKEERDDLTEQERKYARPAATDPVAAALDDIGKDIAEIMEGPTSVGDQSRVDEYARRTLPGDQPPSFLANRRSILERDCEKMRDKKRSNQSQIARLRAENAQLTQSIRSNEDALDRLMENEA